jgi:hypothetical protein
MSRWWLSVGGITVAVFVQWGAIDISQAQQGQPAPIPAPAPKAPPGKADREAAHEHTNQMAQQYRVARDLLVKALCSGNKKTIIYAQTVFWDRLSSLKWAIFEEANIAPAVQSGYSDADSARRAADRADAAKDISDALAAKAKADAASRRSDQILADAEARITKSLEAQGTDFSEPKAACPAALPPCGAPATPGQPAAPASPSPKTPPVPPPSGGKSGKGEGTAFPGASSAQDCTGTDGVQTGVIDEHVLQGIGVEGPTLAQPNRSAGDDQQQTAAPKH